MWSRRRKAKLLFLLQLFFSYSTLWVYFFTCARISDSRLVAINVTILSPSRKVPFIKRNKIYFFLFLISFNGACVDSLSCASLSHTHTHTLSLSTLSKLSMSEAVLRLPGKGQFTYRFPTGNPLRTLLLYHCGDQEFVLSIMSEQWQQIS